MPNRGEIQRSPIYPNSYALLAVQEHPLTHAIFVDKAVKTLHEFITAGCRASFLPNNRFARSCEDDEDLMRPVKSFGRVTSRTPVRHAFCWNGQRMGDTLTLQGKSAN